MADRNWARIESGVTFEALATTIVWFEDPKAALFGRRGRDGGQDVRSGDGTLVYQAKHHEDGSAAKAIADAKKEAAKIGRYRQPTHARHGQWAGVSNWRLVTNAAFNPTNRQTWDDEVVPLFKALGLAVDFWEQANLDALLDKHPEVHRSFFGGETRVFLSIPEARDALLGDEPFLVRSDNGTFFGRQSELQAIQDFLDSDSLFLLVHGAGGIGKTRLMVEAGDIIASTGHWQVLWANVATMTMTGSWFAAIVPERPTLLLVDEPADEKVLQLLSEQLRGRTARSARWKFAVAVRSPKDPVVRFLHGPRVRHKVAELALGALPQTDAESMCADLLASGALSSATAEWRTDAARLVAERFARHPVWMTLAVHLLESHGDLSRVPATAEALADDYLQEIVSLHTATPSEVVRSLLRWAALIGPVDREDDSVVRVLAAGSGVEDVARTRRIVTELVTRRALTDRGARNRLIELKPDVLRDHVLLRWLAVQTGPSDDALEPSSDALSLVASVRSAGAAGNISKLGRSVLVSLARTELLLSIAGTPVDLLDGFFEGVQGHLDGMSAPQRVAMAEVLVDIARFRPDDAVRLSAALRQSSVGPTTVEGLFGEQSVGHDDVVLELGWPVFHAAMGARSPDHRQRVLDELCALASAEAEIAERLPRGLPNDGKRAKDLIGRALHGGPEFWGDFEEQAKRTAIRLLRQSVEGGGLEEHAAPLQSLITPALSLERRQTWSESFTVHIQTLVAMPGHPAWQTRIELRSELMSLVERAETPVAVRRFLWGLLAEAHRSANQCRERGDDAFRSELRHQLLEDLTWAREVLSGRTEELEEVAAARDVWAWHHRFEKDGEIKAAADALEDLYAANEVAGEFEPLLSFHDYEGQRTRMAAKAAEIAASAKSDEIQAFLRRGAQFLGSAEELTRLGGVAWALGEHAAGSPAVSDFVYESLAGNEPSPTTRFAVTVAVRWLAELRQQQGSGAALELLNELVAKCGSEQQVLNLVLTVYGRLPPLQGVGTVSGEEHNYVRGLKALFLRHDAGPGFIGCIAWALDHDWPGLRDLLSEVLDSLTDASLVPAVRVLVDAVYWSTREDGAPDGAEQLGFWLMSQIARVPFPDELGGNFDWHLKEVLGRVGRPGVAWLADTLTHRSALEAERGYERYHAVGSQLRFSNHVEPISLEGPVEAATADSVRRFLSLATDRGTVGYHLPSILQDIDPEGHVVPDTVVAMLGAGLDKDGVWRLARTAAAYPVGVDPWRTIARVVVRKAIAAASKEEKNSLFGCLSDRGVRSWSGTPGEVPSVFIDAVESAKRTLSQEEDQDLREFWAWRLAIAEAELRDQEEHAKEERGE